jgi:hypothetical protein
MVLIGGTIGFFNSYERYEGIGSELLTDPEFREGFTHWNRSGRGVAEILEDGRMIILRADEPSADVAVRQSLSNPQRFRLLRLSGELKVEDIRPGERFWQKGRLVLASFDADRRMMSVPHVVADLEGNQSWQTYRQVFRVPEGVVEMRVGIQLIGATGILLARNLSLQEVRERDHYSWYRGAGMSLWAVALLWISLPYFARLRLNAPHLLIGMDLVGIFVGTLMPAKFKMEMDSGIGTALFQIVQIWGSDDQREHEVSLLRAPLDSLVISKAGHFLFFALLAFAVRWAHPKGRWPGLLFGLLILAVVSEVLQFFVDHRLPRLGDLIIDGAGVVLGLTLFEILRRVRMVMATK